MFHLIPAVASVSPRGAEGNQDRVAVVRVDDGRPAAGIVLCDGVGSRKGSGTVAEEVAALASRHLAVRGMESVFWELGQALAEAQFGEPEGATTLIAVGADETGLVGHLFIGNGSLLEIQPIEPAGSAPTLAWTELALPQITLEGGRPALRSFLPAPPGSFEALAGYRRAGMDRARMYLACSDGISTGEECPQAHAPDGTFWKEVPVALVRVLDALSAHWGDLVTAQPVEAGEAFRGVLEGVLHDLLDEQQLGDDASLAALLMRPGGVSPQEAGQ